MYLKAHFGEGTGPILMDGVGCMGSESRLFDCPHDTDTAEDSHAEDAGVHCQLQLGEICVLLDIVYSLSLYYIIMIPLCGVIMSSLQ